MGKQSRRKKVTKKAHQERQQECREGVNEVVHRDDTEVEKWTQEEEEAKEVEVGQRVRFDVGNGWRRGVLKSMNESSNCAVLPLDADDRKDLYVKVPRKQVIQRDFSEWTIRFQVGDRVVCCSDVWTPATVSRLWLIEYKNPSTIPFYECEIVDRKARHLSHLWSPPDHENSIVRRPDRFHFSVGDEIVFDSRRSK